jgi:hypothetical protein
VNVAFNYAARSALADLKYLARFDLVVTGGILSRDQIDTLQSRNAELIVYVWSSAFYPGEGSPAQRGWANLARRNSATWLLSEQAAGGGAASPGKVAWWYDFGDEDLPHALADHVSSLIKNSGYKGAFLDTLGSESVPAALLNEFRRRHPGKLYNKEQARFISLLRERLGKERIIFTNQAYRSPEHFLDHADFDLIENSSMWTDSSGATRYRPWRQAGNWESIQVAMSKLVVPAAQSYPKTRFVHLNVAVGGPASLQRAVNYGYACARLWNQSSFTVRPGMQRPIRSSIYFNRLGSPLKNSYNEDAERGIAWRVFENGVVALNSSRQQHRIHDLNLDLSDPPRGYLFLGKGV